MRKSKTLVIFFCYFYFAIKKGKGEIPNLISTNATVTLKNPRFRIPA